MTKPTEEQIKALKPGDRVLVEMYVVANGSAVEAVPWEGADMSEVRAYSHDGDLIHSILPREIKVGDKVRWAGGGDDEPWEVVAGPRLCRVRPVEYAVWRAGEGFAAVSAGSLEVVS